MQLLTSSTCFLIGLHKKMKKLCPKLKEYQKHCMNPKCSPPWEHSSMGQSNLRQSLNFPKGFFSLFCYSLIISICHTKNTFCHSNPYIGVVLFKICSTYFKNGQIFNKKHMKFHSSCFSVLKCSNFLESVVNFFKVDVYVSFPEVIMISWDSPETLRKSDGL